MKIRDYEDTVYYKIETPLGMVKIACLTQSKKIEHDNFIPEQARILITVLDHPEYDDNPFIVNRVKYSLRFDLVRYDDSFAPLKNNYGNDYDSLALTRKDSFGYNNGTDAARSKVKKILTECLNEWAEDNTDKIKAGTLKEFNNRIRTAEEKLNEMKEQVTEQEKFVQRLTDMEYSLL